MHHFEYLLTLKCLVKLRRQAATLGSFLPNQPNPTHGFYAEMRALKTENVDVPVSAGMVLILSNNFIKYN